MEHINQQQSDMKDVLPNVCLNGVLTLKIIIAYILSSIKPKEHKQNAYKETHMKTTFL